MSVTNNIAATANFIQARLETSRLNARDIDATYFAFLNLITLYEQEVFRLEHELAAAQQSTVEQTEVKRVSKIHLVKPLGDPAPPAPLSALGGLFEHLVQAQAAATVEAPPSFGPPRPDISGPEGSGK